MKISVYLYRNGVAIHYFNNLGHTIKCIHFPRFMRKQVKLLAMTYQNRHPDLEVHDFPILVLDKQKED